MPKADRSIHLSDLYAHICALFGIFLNDTDPLSEKSGSFFVQKQQIRV